jgi:hypothetical protein
MIDQEPFLLESVPMPNRNYGAFRGSVTEHGPQAGGKPKAKNGEVVPEPAAKVARQDGMVRTLVKAGAVAVAILGGSHDLAESMQRVAPPWCEYLRVTVQAYQEVE